MSSAETTAQLTGGRRLSIRWKVLIGFTVLFSLVYLLALNLFTNLAVDAADKQIQEDLTQTMEGIAENVNVDKLIDLAATGEANDEGFSDDPRFVEILAYLDEVHQVEPDAWPYLYIPHDTKEGYIYFVVDVWANYDPGSAGAFLEEYQSNSGWIVKGLSGQVYRAVDSRIVQDIKNYAKSISESSPGIAETLTNFGDWLTDTGISPEKEFGTYGDKFGRWASGYMPLINDAGQKVAAVGVDFQADYVNQVRDEVSNQVRNAFLVSYPVLMILVIVVTSLFTQPLLKLSGNAERIAEGDYEVDFSDLMKGRYKDEIDTLASVFEVMVDKVREREQTLKRQVAQLKIEIDESKKKSEVSEIVDTDFFKDLQSRASKLRDKRTGEE